MGRKRRKKFKQFNFRLDPKLSRWGSLVFCCLILLIGIGYAIYASGVFRIKEEDIKSNLLLSRSLKEKIKGKSLFDLDIKSLSSTLINARPEYKEVYVYRVFPSCLKIEGVKRMPFAQIKDIRFYPVDKEAIVLSEGSLQPLDDLILIEIGSNNRSLKKGNSIESRSLEYAFDLVRAINEEGFLNEGRVALINASSLEAIDFIFIRKNCDTEDSLGCSGIRVKVGKGDFRRKISLFKNLMDNELKDKMPLLQYIDLRFKKVYMDFRR